METKVEYVKEHLKRAATLRAGEMAANQLLVNFLSGSNFWKVGCWPAATVNVECRRHLAIDHVVGSGDGDGGTGVVVCDYVGEGGDWQLVRLIVAMNAWIEKTGRVEVP
jgi:1-phosphatidylinositol phosphodiesterase